MDKFFAHMQHEEQRIRSILSVNVSMNDLTPEQQAKHDAATVCISCNREFTDDSTSIHHGCG